MITVYHNHKCSKSRCALEFLKDSKKEYEVIDYLRKGITKEELKAILVKLQIKAIDLVRTNEAIWKEQFKDKTLTEDEIIATMVQYPQLIQRPIVMVGDKALIGRPIEKINEII